MQPDPRIGTEIGRYHLEGVLGRGGMGVVYRARQHTDQLERTVALKLLASELSTDEHFRQRFIRESRLASEIDHENIVPIYDAGEVDGQLYIVMRFVDGYDLASLLTREYRLDVERALRILGQAARALDAAHRKGLVHRDVKPGNILIASGVGPDASDHVYLADFGLTKRSASQSGLTKAGHFLGTLDYVAPEQIAGQAVDGAVDLYALGCVLFQCLAGIPPFVRDSDVVLLNAHLHDRPTALSRLRPELGAAIDAVIERALAKDPRQRYATCRELILAARAALASPVTAPLPPRPPLSTPPPAPRRATPRPGTARPPRPVAADGWLRTNGLLVAIGAAALVASVIFGVVVFNALGTGGTAFESAAGSPRPSLSLSPATVLANGLVPGDCFNTDADQVDRIFSVACDRPHVFETFFTYDLALGDSYPGDDALQSAADERCTLEFASFVGTDYESSALYLTAIRPSESTWADSDRRVICALHERDKSEMTGSAQGSGR